MTDIAKAVGVSQSTVSLVLNRMPGAKLSAETRQRVIATAEAMGYRLPTRRSTAAVHSARSAAPSPRQRILYLTDEIATSPHPAVTMDGARTLAWENSLLLAIHVTGGDRELEESILDSARADASVLGVIYATIITRGIEASPALGALREAGKPLVLLNCTSTDRALSSVIPAEVSGGYAATEHLIAQGHARIGFINGEPWMDAARDRLKGYRQALATADLPFDGELVREGDWMSSSGFEHALALMQLARPPSAILCANDMMALGALDAMKQFGKAVPSQVSIVGYDDVEVARHAHPPLTTVLLPNFAMGQWAVERVIEEAAAHTPPPPRQIKMECPLVERQSVGAAPRAGKQI
ncbi:LacI family DNA-binding transcriptional regulator [Variovorax sp. OV329]|uniref:LacI family DNA-binding transcriptional regulator n=1 Tax=Variovorax sp. OV329 TaxID=1882825 RepID=UPI0008E95AC1|nr:LacI family DNA-binding transcriptional regulator [Variovorax sp. OV329]SFM32916.1 transcriptional regulator, LacI family [Variovorax sp. OV329]